MTLEHSLLSEGAFHVQPPNGPGLCLTLPEVLAQLSAGEDMVFTHLRPHQRPAWHAFLVQLAYLALEADDDPVLPTEPQAWAAKLRTLTPGHDDDAPWCLLNADWQRPAFMQPPCNAARVADFKRSVDSAQDIDMLVTARQHDEKAAKMHLSQAPRDALVYALITLQGWASFMGAGNYNVMRMNGGFSSRPQFRLAFARGSGAEFVRDARALFETADDWLDRADTLGIGTGLAKPHALLWLLAWEGGSLPLSDVHPLCLEVSRRVRLVRDGGQLLLKRASSDAMRVDAKSRQGNVLDPWAPLVLDGAPRALTAQPHTLGYRSLQGLLFDRSRFELPLLARPSPGERRAGHPAVLLAQVLVSGDGRTDGLANRELLMPPQVWSHLAEAPAEVARRSQTFVDLAGKASGKAFRSALIQFMDASDDVEWKNRDFDKAVAPYVTRYEQAIDEAFFPVLFDSIEHARSDDAAERAWTRWLADAAAEHLAASSEALPTRDSSRWLARARAERVLRGGLRKQFGPLLDRDNPPSESQPTTDTGAAHV